MGATTTEGVGLGEGIIGSKGGDGGSRNIYQSVNDDIILPQLVRAMTVESGAGGLITITFDVPLEGSESNYTITLASEGMKPTITAKNDNTDGDFESFIVNSVASNTITFTIYSNGTAGFQAETNL